MRESAANSSEPARQARGQATGRLLEAALSLAGELDVAALAPRLRPALEGLPRACVAGLGVHDDEHEVVRRFVVDLERPDAALERNEARQSESELTLFGRSPETYVSPAFAGGAPAPLRWLSRWGVQRCVVVPLVLPERFVGSLFVGFRDEAPPSADEVGYLEQLGRLITPVMWNCATHERFRKGDRRRDTLIALGSAINASLEFEAVLAAARSALDSIADEAGCTIDLIESDGQHYDSHRAGGRLYPRQRPENDGVRLPVGGSPLAWVREHRRTYESDDLTRTTRFEIDAELREAGVRRYVIAPMIIHGDVIGAIFIGSTDAHPALRIDVWLYENIALQVGLAIESARRLRQLRELSENLTQQNVYLREEIQSEHDYGEMVGRSPYMDRLRESIQRVAGIDSIVLITGPTGSGKELVARAIHATSTRANQPMVKVNCAAIPETMVESELFGHERGAFTSAVAQRIGRFELARDGTLFLDEIGELSLAVQAKLLRVLQDGEFERVGGTKTLHSNARIITATNRNLLRSADAGTFRSDLYYRLNVFPIHVPALDQRREDVPLLVDAFIAQFNRRMGRQFQSIDPASLKDLMQRPWPGNVRELRHVIERAMILCDGPVLHVEPGGAPRAAGNGEPPPPAGGALRTLDEVAADHIRQALAATNSRIEGPGGAADLLGVKASTLRSRMKKLGVSR